MEDTDMLGRDFFVTNRWQKLFSLVLAILIWLAVRTGIALAPPESPGHEAQHFDHVPLTVLTAASDLGHYRLQPEQITVVLRGDAAVLDKIDPAQIEAYVNLAETTHQGTRPIHVYPPPGTELVTMQPREVLVESLPPVEAGGDRK